MNDQATTVPAPTEGLDPAAPRPCLVAGKHLIPLGAEGRTAMLLARIGSVISELGDERLAAVGLDSSDYAILAILDSDGPGSQQELAELLGKAPGLLVAALDGLEERKLVARVRDPADRRRSRVALTAAGRRTLARADKLDGDFIAELFPGLDEAERAELARLLASGLRPDPGAPGA